SVQLTLAGGDSSKASLELRFERAAKAKEAAEILKLPPILKLPEMQRALAEALASTGSPATGILMTAQVRRTLAEALASQFVRGRPRQDSLQRTVPDFGENLLWLLEAGSVTVAGGGEKDTEKKTKGPAAVHIEISLPKASFLVAGMLLRPPHP